MDGELKATDVTVFDSPAITTAGVRQLRVVRYMIGTHGPFTDSYPVTEVTPERIRAGIQKNIDLLRGVLQGY